MHFEILIKKRQRNMYMDSIFAFIQFFHGFVSLYSSHVRGLILMKWSSDIPTVFQILFHATLYFPPLNGLIHVFVILS